MRPLQNVLVRARGKYENECERDVQTFRDWQMLFINNISSIPDDYVLLGASANCVCLCC